MLIQNKTHTNSKVLFVKDPFCIIVLFHHNFFSLQRFFGINRNDVYPDLKTQKNSSQNSFKSSYCSFIKKAFTTTKHLSMFVVIDVEYIDEYTCLFRIFCAFWDKFALNLVLI